MSKKVHLKTAGVDCRDQGQLDDHYNNQALCGFAGVTVTRTSRDVDCKLCLSKMDEYSSDDDLYFDNSM